MPNGRAGRRLSCAGRAGITEWTASKGGRWLPYRDYLDAEALAGVKHEYVDGAIVRVDTANRGYYPDVTVICGPVETAPDDRHGATNPTAIFEVLSPTREAEDRGEKFASYRTRDALRDYVLVSTHTPRIEHFRRGERVALATGRALAVDEVFDGVTLDERPPRGG